MQVTEFERGIDSKDLTLADNCVFVIWKLPWGSVEAQASDDESTNITVIPETPPRTDSDDNSLVNAAADLDVTDESECAQITHSVTFKCIGSTKEQQNLEALACIAQL